MSSSDSDSQDESMVFSRLGACEVCGDKDALYTCPKCELKTCSLNCVRVHKTELECDGLRDRTKFIRMNHFSDTDLLSDYRLLEECSRFVYGLKRDEKKKFTRIDKDLPIHLYKLKMAARKRGTVLQFLAQNFTRHLVNTTRYHYKTNIIHWRVEWIFPNAEPDILKFIDEKCIEHITVAELLDKYLNPNVVFDGSKALSFYKSVGFRGVKVLLKAEKVRESNKKFFEIDVKESLAENLSGKCIVEFPIIYVVLKDHAYNFDIISPEDEFDYNNDEIPKNKEENACNGLLDNQTSSSIEVRPQQFSQPSDRYKRNRELLTEKIAREKQQQIEKEIKADKKKKPKNLLITTDYSSDETSSDCDNEK